MTSISSPPPSRPELNPSFYDLQGDELAFFKKQTGIHDDDELKKHILRVQAKAYEIHGYPCICTFSFLRMKISKTPGYQQALKLLQWREKPILLDFGCCFGNDIRKVVEDGWPVEGVIGFDLHKEFWGFGHELFMSTPETFPAAFLAGDAFDPAVIAPPYEPCLPPTIPSREPLPPLNTLTSFHRLRHRISAIYVSSVFHLFSEVQQLKLAKIISSLLSPEKGSIIFGRHIALPEKGPHQYLVGGPGMFCHSPSTWKELWEKVMSGQVRVDVKLIKIERKDSGPREEGKEKSEAWLMRWAVTRL